MVTIRLDRLTKVYDGEVAVDGVDLTIDDGEFFVVLGPSGCGKSSLIRMVAGLEDISGGDVSIDGRSMHNVPARCRGVGMMFQNSAVYPHLTVRDNIGFPLQLEGRRRGVIDRRVGEVASLVGLTDVLDLLPARLSGGMRQRVAMARALVREPAMLLMDEPMSNLDAKLRTELRMELATIHRRCGATTVYVTHDQVEAMALADRAAVMRSGRVVQCDTPTVLYHRPANLFVATFVGSPAMNVVRAKLEGTPRELVLAFGDDRIEIGEFERWTGIHDWIGHHVGVGLRAEAFSLAEHAGPTTCRVQVVRVEHLGSQVLVWATLGATGVADVDGEVVVGPDPFTTVSALFDDHVEVDLWKPVHFEVDTDQLHLFDLQTGVAIGGSARSGSR